GRENQHGRFGCGGRDGEVGRDRALRPAASAARVIRNIGTKLLRRPRALAARVLVARACLGERRQQHAAEQRGRTATSEPQQFPSSKLSHCWPPSRTLCPTSSDQPKLVTRTCKSRWADS